MKLAEVTAKYLNEPFEKYGCIELVVSVMADLGRPLPDEVDGMDVHNYRGLVEKNLREAEFMMLRAFQKIGRPGNARFPATGDLLVILQKSRSGLFPAVALGNNLALASFIRKGVQVFKMDAYNFPVLARSLI